VKRIERQEPAIGILEHNSYPGSTSKWFTVQCDCSDTNCSVVSSIEIEADTEMNSLCISHYANVTSPLPRRSRWKAIWELVWRGHTDYQHDFIVNGQTARNWLGAMTSAVEELEKGKKK